MNKAILVGNLGNDPEVRTTGSGKQVATFSLATSERYKDRTTGEQKSVTDWHNVVLWSPLADIAAKYLKKGSKILIEGRIKTRVLLMTSARPDILSSPGYARNSAHYLSKEFLPPNSAICFNKV